MDHSRQPAVSKSAMVSKDDKDHPDSRVVKESNQQCLAPGAQLRARNELLGTIVDNIPVMLVVTDPFGRVVSVNGEFERVTGWTSQELFGSDPWLTCFPEEPARREVRDFLKSEEPGWREFPLSTRWGTSVETSWANVRLDDGSVIGIAIDIRTQRETTRRMSEANRAIQQRADQLKTAALELTQAEQDERKGLAQILHDDLQQLLVGAKFRIFALKAQLSDPRLDASVEDVHALIAESIEVCRCLSHRLSPDVLCQAGLAPALEWLARYCWDTHQLDVNLDLDPSVNPPSQAIRNVLFHSARELLINVARHSGTNRASMRLADSGEFTELTVSDAGRGFDHSTVRSTGGSGLLRIEERARLLGGMLSIDTWPGRGSRLSLALPSGPIPTKPPETIAIRQTVSADKNRNKGRNIRLMLVDDHNIVRQGLTLLLSQHPGLEVVGEAGNGQEAVELARILCPDVVLMDVSMPVMDGVEATKLIKSENPGIEVIGLSTFSETVVHKKMIEAGASGYVSKGGPSEVLADTIRHVCRNREASVERLKILEHEPS